MKKIVQSFFMLMLITTLAFAQERTVTGTVTAKDDGLPIPGASVKLKGGAIATQTNANGAFSIKVTGNNPVLIISYIGNTSQEIRVGASNMVNATLAPDNKQLGEVVVTALGISKAKKTLGFSTTTINNEELNRASVVSPLQGLMGKIAGASISTTSGSPGGSTKIILRGYSSITGSSQPLFIVDGVPINNDRPGGLVSGIGSLGYNYDFGNAANDINPDDIESITVLKGASSTNLYGSRGSNGVIVITTKRGKAGQFKVDFSSAASYTKISMVPQFQKKFGQGWDGTFIPSENGSWGPALDGVVRPWGAVVNNSQLLKPFSYIDNNYRDAFDLGAEYNNNITISGGNESSTYRFTYGNIASDGILPTDADSYKRNNLNFVGSTKYKNFDITSSINYVAKTTKFVEVGGAKSASVTGNFYEDILQMPSDIPIRDLKNYKNQYFNVDNYFTPFASNPYYSIYENGSKSNSDRVYGNVDMHLKATDWMTLQFQQGYDISNYDNKIYHAKNAPTPGSYNDGGNVEGATRQAYTGDVILGAEKYFEFDSKLQALFNKKITNDFSFDGLLGLNLNDRGGKGFYSGVEDLTIPGIYTISNSLNKPTTNSYEQHRRLFGAYASTTFGYKDYLYLTLNARNDWSSTLPTDQRSYFYPGANLSFLPSEVLDLKAAKINFWKLRASYGQTGKDASPYSVFNTIRPSIIPVRGTGTTIAFPIGGVSAYTVNDQLNNSSLQPEITSELELGTEVKFFDNRLGFDFTYYNKVSDHQALPVDIAPSTGYQSFSVNFGKVRNRGIELAVNIKPLVNKFKWDIDYTFSRNRNMVLSLPNGLKQYVINEAYDAQFLAIVGQPLGVFKAPVPKTDPLGRTIVNESNGLPIAATDSEIYGTMQNDFMMGLNNSFSYKGFRLSFLLDYRKGGKFYSGTADLLNFTGNDVKTLYNDRRPFVVPNSVIENVDANGKSTYSENTIPIGEGLIDDYNYHSSNKAMAYKNRILDKSFLKLREITLGYTLPKTFTSKFKASQATVSIFSRNIILWLPKDNRTIDPELSSYGFGLGSEFGEFRTGPSTMNFGASLKVSF
jgi:TonB-linked SusC/RagA family outer membrane protein